MDIFGLPAELLTHSILPLLGASVVTKTDTVCKQWLIWSRDNFLWETLVRESFANQPLSSQIEEYASSSGWREAFKEFCTISWDVRDAALAKASNNGKTVTRVECSGFTNWLITQVNRPITMERQRYYILADESDFAIGVAPYVDDIRTSYFSGCGYCLFTGGDLFAKNSLVTRAELGNTPLQGSVITVEVELSPTSRTVQFSREGVSIPNAIIKDLPEVPLYLTISMGITGTSATIVHKNKTS